MRSVIGNWKMNMLGSEAEAFLSSFLATYQPKPGVEAGVAAPFTLLREMATRLQGTGVNLYAQNGHAQPKGAYTGEISMVQLKDAGCHGVLLGHSERRQYFGETEATLVPKIQAAWAHGLLPVLCIGETLEERQGGTTLDVLRRQLAILSETGFGPMTIAYEPVWAIGTGLVATTEQIAEVHAFIRAELVKLLGEQARDMGILYGGSVTPDNFPEIIQVQDVAGGLVGGASLDAAKLQKLVDQA